MPRSIPRLFAIVRNAYEPCLQILEAIPCLNRHRMHTLGDMRDCYEIESYPYSREVEGRTVYEHNYYNQDRNIFVLKYIDPRTHEVQEVKYWITPFYLTGVSTPNIPILEFQYRSWLPPRYDPFPIHTDMERMMRTLHEIQQERLREIRIREDTEADRGHSNYPRRHHYPFHANDYDPFEGHISPNLNEIIPRRRPSSRAVTPPRVVEAVRVVEVPVERVVVQQKALPLPKAVGDLLIASARKTTDSCPIAATPFAECEKLCVSSCFHIFDKESLATWQQTHNTCPVCRCKIENVVSE